MSETLETSDLAYVTDIDGEAIYYQYSTGQMVRTAEDVPYVVNELDIELVGAPTNLNPWVGINSASRQQMQATHMKQRLVVAGVTKRRNQTGVEREFAKYTFAHRVPTNATVIAVIPKYPKTIGFGSIKENPSTLVIYEDFETKEIGHILLDKYFFQHTSLGWKYKENAQAMSRLQHGANFGKGTVLADSPCVDNEGNYMYGIETNVAYMTIPGIIEDGFVVSDEYVQKLATTMLGVRNGSCGKTLFPLNLYGDENYYKPFPGPGDRIRDDGLVMAFRPLDVNLMTTDLHPRNLLSDRVDFEFDKTIYGEPGAKVVDVDVLHDHNKRFHTTPTGMEAEMMRYVSAKDQFYTKILKTYRDLKRRRGAGLAIDTHFHGLVVEAIANFKDSSQFTVQRVLNKVPLDDFNISIKYAYTKVPTIGYKITDTHGTKGVIVDIRPKADMPCNSEGVHADVIKDPLSVIKRSNGGQIYEQWTNNASFQAAKRALSLPSWQDAFDELMRYYRAASPYMYYHCKEILNDDHKRKAHVEEVQKDGIYLRIPPNSPNIGMQQVRDIEANHPSFIGPVTYRGNSGRMITTKRPVVIATKYMMLLDKTGEDWSAVSIAKRQHHGIVSQLSRADKYLGPNRESAVRFGGESEVRLMGSVMESDAVAEVLDRTNSLATSEHINYNLLEAEQPTNIQSLVNRKVVPRGQARPLQLMKHLVGCAGSRFVYAPYRPAQ